MCTRSRCGRNARHDGWPTSELELCRWPSRQGEGRQGKAKSGQSHTEPERREKTRPLRIPESPMFKAFRPGSVCNARGPAQHTHTHTHTALRVTFTATSATSTTRHTSTLPHHHHYRVHRQLFNFQFRLDSTSFSYISIKFIEFKCNNASLPFILL